MSRTGPASYHHPGAPLHREGRTLVAITLIAFLATILPVARYGSGASRRTVTAVWLGVLAFILRFFRHPSCTTPDEPDVVVAPASGHVVHIGLEDEPEILREQRLRISVFLSIFDAHLTRSPLTGRVLEQRYSPGKYLVALHPKSSTLNERNSILLAHPDGTRILVRQVAGFLARRICSYVVVGQAVLAGQELGFIKLGSRVDLFLPVTSTVLVTVGQAVRAGETPLARFTQA